jgi:alpha-aminoadipate carrier protein LysW
LGNKGEYPECPACESEIELDELDVDRGQKIGCPECGVTLQVLATSPIELDIADEEISEWGES